VRLPGCVVTPERRRGTRGIFLDQSSIALDVVSTARLYSCCDTIRYADEEAEKTGRMPARHMAWREAKKLGKIGRATSPHEHRNAEISLRILATSMPRLTTRTSQEESVCQIQKQHRDGKDRGGPTYSPRRRFKARESGNGKIPAQG
jgi:hypothetical protein